MGYIKHDAVIVTCSDYALERGRWPGLPDVLALVDEFRATLAESWRPLVIGPIASPVNGYVTFAFLPDGSKEYWSDSDEGDRLRARFAAIFNWAHDDGSTPFDVVRVAYGGDYGVEVGVTAEVG